MEEIVVRQSDLDMPLEGLKDYIERIISSYCPYVDDRNDLICNGNSPEFDIRITSTRQKSSILFLTSVFLQDKPLYVGHIKASIPERARLDHLINFDELSEIIDFIKEDHKYLNELSFHEMLGSIYPYRINMIFKISWPDFAGKKINCGDIKIEMEFMDEDMAHDFNKELTKKYKPRLIYEYSNKNNIL